MSLIRSLLRPRERAQTYPYTIDDIGDLFRSGGFVLGNNYTTTLGSLKEEIPGDFVGLVYALYRANPVVSAAVVKRMQIFAQARFRYREMRNGEPGATFGKADLSLLEHPEPTLSTADLLKRALLDADFAGNWFGIRRPERIKRVRPDWVYIVKGSRRPGGEIDDVDTEVLGIVYQAGGPYSDHEPEAFSTGEYAHFAPIPDPLANYRGMSWMTPIIRDAQADQLLVAHKTAFLEHGATPNVLVKFPPTLDKTKALEFQEIFEQEHEGAYNAYRTVFLGGGADLSVVGSNMQQLDFKAIQGAGETRIAMASGVPAVLLQISEGLQGSSLNAGNYAAARKQFADGPMRDLWQTMAGALEDILPAPRGSELWYDEDRIPFLAEDATDAANILNLKATAMRTLWDGGADPDSAIEAVNSGDMTRLKHTGKPSVQLQEGGGAPPPDDGSEPPPEGEEPPDDEQARALITALASHGITAELTAYSPTQPRRADGKFGTKGAGGGRSAGGGGTSVADVEKIIQGPAVPIDRWGKGPTQSPETAVDNLMDKKPANIKAEDVRPALDHAADLDKAATAKIEAGDPAGPAERERVRNADLTDLQVSGTLDFGGDGLNIARKDMPQFTGKKPDGTEQNVLPAFLEHVKAKGVKVEEHTTQDPHTVRPSQSEVSIAKVGGMVQATRAGTMKRTAEVVIAQDPKSGDKFVVDGHHGWGVATAMKYDDPKVTMTATVIHAPILDVLADAIDFTEKAGVARQGMSTSTGDQKKAAVNRAWEEWAKRHPDRVEPPPQPLTRIIEMATLEVRCPSGHLLAEVATPPYRFTCPKCKAVVAESGRWAVTTDPKVVSYSPSQPRRSDGKFGTKGGSAGGGVSGVSVAGETEEGKQGRNALQQDKDALIQEDMERQVREREPDLKELWLKMGMDPDKGNAMDATENVSQALKAEAMRAIGADLDAQFSQERLGEVAARLEARSGVGATEGERVADAVLGGWSHSAWDPAFGNSIAFQVAVGKEFRTGISPHMQREFDEMSVSRGIAHEDAASWPQRNGYDMPVMQAAARSMYDHTQKKLDALGVGDTVTVHRGIGREIRGDEVTVDTNPASSWSVARATARGFAESEGSNTHSPGTVLTMTVPRERILAVPGSGVGCFEEAEVVLVRADGDTARGEAP